MDQQPTVSFVITVFNGEKTIQAAIESVLAQTYAAFEIIVIDDGSTDRTAAVVVAMNDPRIVLHQNLVNKDIPRSANKGLLIARGKYIARLDADDLCLPGRLEAQTYFLDRHPDVAVVGSFMDSFYDARPNESAGVLRYPTDPPAVDAGLIFRNTIAQPSAMLRRHVLQHAGLLYDEAFPRSEDYDLWARCSEKKLGLANLPEVLTRYRLHPGQTTVKDNPTMAEAAHRVRARLVAQVGVQHEEVDLLVHEALAVDRFLPVQEFINDATNWLFRLAEANYKSNRFDHSAFLSALTGRFVSLVRFARLRGLNHTRPEDTPFHEFVSIGAL